MQGMSEGQKGDDEVGHVLSRIGNGTETGAKISKQYGTHEN